MSDLRENTRQPMTKEQIIEDAKKKFCRQNAGSKTVIIEEDWYLKDTTKGKELLDFLESSLTSLQKDTEMKYEPILVACAGFLDVFKSWEGPGWSEYDKSIRQEITRLLKEMKHNQGI
jgi:hypothetical protein